MDTILLVIPDDGLRQLYHELLFTGTLEVVPVKNISSALLMLSLTTYHTTVLYVEDSEISEIKTFLQIRKENQNLLKSKIILLTDEYDVFLKLITPQDTILNLQNFTPEIIVEEIKKSLNTPITL